MMLLDRKENYLRFAALCGRRAVTSRLLWTLCTATPVIANGQHPTSVVFRDPTFEQLAAATVTSVAHKDQNYFTTAAAVYVISAEEIRRAGVRSIPEALRLAPGVEVARINTHRYAVGIRGFNNEFTTKLLVLQDGRYLYTPLFAGTFWDMQDTLLDDIERIEVVRGPGGTTWGANAVNGVINIVTKHANDTRGLLVTAAAGTEERAFGALRYGGDFVGGGAFRVFLTGASRDESVFPDEVAVPPASAYPPDTASSDDWRQVRGGFRVDTFLTSRDSIAVHGEAYEGLAHQYDVLGDVSDIDVSGAYLLSRWKRSYAPGSEWSAQVYYDSSQRETYQGVTNRDEWAVEAVRRMPLFDRHDLTLGVHYRASRNETLTTPGLSFAPVVRDLVYSSAFVDDAVNFFDRRLVVSAGLKLERNSFTGTEELPNVRILWQPSDAQTWWTAYSRGARLPSIADNDSTATFPGLLALPNTELPVEEVNALELGWRMRARDRWTLDIAAFHNDYDQLRTRETSFIPSPFTVVRTRDSKLEGTSNGVEAALAVKVVDAWRIQVNGSYLDVELDLDPTSTDMSAPDEVGVSPQWQGSLRSALRIGNRWELDVVYRLVGALAALDVPSYQTFDLRASWQATRHLQIVLVGQNLLDDRHLEFRAAALQPPGSEIERGAYVQLRWNK